MAETLITYTEKVQREVDNFSNTAKLVIEQTIRDTYNEILSHTHSYLVGIQDTTVHIEVGYRVIDVPGFYRVEKIRFKPDGDTQYRPLEKLDHDEYMRREVSSTQKEPVRWYVTGKKIALDVPTSIPGDIYIEYYPRQSQLDGSIASVIPDDFTHVVLLGSIARFKAYEQLPDASEYYKQYKGSYGTMGVVGGALRQMMKELAASRPIGKLRLFGRK